jgi:hypothetical protein
MALAYLSGKYTMASVEWYFDVYHSILNPPGSPDIRGERNFWNILPRYFRLKELTRSSEVRLVRHNVIIKNLGTALVLGSG